MFPNSCKVLSTITFNGGKLFCTIAETAASYATAAETEIANITGTGDRLSFATRQCSKPYLLGSVVR